MSTHPPNHRGSSSSERRGPLFAGVPSSTFTHPPILLRVTHREALVFIKACGSKGKISGDFRQMFCTTRSTTLQVQHLHTPSQPNLYDYGVIVLKFMELWDDVEKYEDNTMPTYVTEELQQVREKYVCDWILDVDNMQKDEVLQDLGLMYMWLNKDFCNVIDVLFTTF
ncbi:hypothetical protein LR48_Vigan01g194800 [Vigna angularis]|uniref:Uncharacterized protein n=1 Tax=Phaseolus angularis TaxID=3914 RepID=A0A0L9TPJ2_PHAAN|nr:hypothetical protein LR48_Vigan01g194800 [Vigna angularis]